MIFALAAAHWILALFALVLLLMPLFVGKEEDYSLEVPPGDDDLSPLAARRAAHLEALRDLEFEWAAGKISREEYERSRSRTITEAANVLREIEKEHSLELAEVEREIGARKAQRPGGKS